MLQNQFIEKKVVQWEINCGQIMFSGEKNLTARDIFKDYFGKVFTLKTPRGEIHNVSFLHKLSKGNVRLSCSKYFKQLKDGDIIYFKIKDEDTIEITDKKPDTNSPTTAVGNKNYSVDELKDIVIKLTVENQKLRELNSELQEYKERLDKYDSLDKIFKDEKFMEDWLASNIHRIISDLDVIDRQTTVTWPDLKKSRFDLMCIDKTTKELVVVENKVRGRNKTLETQYLTYKAWIKNNLAEINKRYKEHGLKATKNFKIIIITDTIDEKLETMCSGNTIPLIFIDGGVAFEQIVPYDD